MEHPELGGREDLQGPRLEDVGLEVLLFLEKNDLEARNLRLQLVRNEEVFQFEV
jgi:hypothetical protein